MERADEPGQLLIGELGSERPKGRGTLLVSVEGLSCPDCMLRAAAGPIAGRRTAVEGTHLTLRASHLYYVRRRIERGKESTRTRMCVDSIREVDG